MTKAIAPSKLVPGTQYTLRAKDRTLTGTFEGVGMHNINKPGPLKPYISNGFATAAYGDRFIFTVEGGQVLLRKAFTKAFKGCLVFEDVVAKTGSTIVDSDVKFYA
jgi:hypothetical protein